MVLNVRGRRKRGGPKRRWWDKVNDDMKERGLFAITLMADYWPTTGRINLI